MNQRDREQMGRLLKHSLPPISTQVGVELQRDLWPAMLRRLEARPSVIPWFDWAMLAAVAVWLMFFPEAIPVLLYHL